MKYRSKRLYGKSLSVKIDAGVEPNMRLRDCDSGSGGVLMPLSSNPMEKNEGGVGIIRL